MPQITLGDISIDVIYKDIKNIYLSAYPPSGRIRISAPLRLDLDTIRIFAISKLGWIKKQQIKLGEQERESPREYINRESHYYLGRRYLLKVSEVAHPPAVTLNHNSIELRIRPNTNTKNRQEVLDEWYRGKLKEIIPPLIQKWQNKLNANITSFGIKKMKARWGSCNQKARRIWLNLELAKKPPHCLEYVVVHEMVHLLERKHGKRFITCMDKFLPMWKSCKEELNRSPLSHQDWRY